MNTDIQAYHDKQLALDALICNRLRELINQYLVESDSKVWHGHPVWFIDGNPIVGYSKLKNNVQLMFWSGQSFGESSLHNEGSFKAAVVRYTDISQINESDIQRYLAKAVKIQWDYKNIVKNRGQLERLK